MKRKVSILCCSLLLLGLLSISCSDDEDAIEPRTFIGDITLATQEEVNAFGSENYTRITGSLEIGTSNTRFSITTIAPLISLSSIGGTVIVVQNDNLLTLDGLNNLTTIQGQGGSGTATERSIFGGRMLRNIDALSSLKTVNKELVINGFDNLNNLNGLSNLETALRILIFNTRIQNLDPLSKLTSSSKISIVSNIRLKNLNGLSNVQTQIRDIYIAENEVLDDFCGLRPIFLEHGRIDGSDYMVFDNAYNPSQQNIIGGNCSL